MSNDMISVTEDDNILLGDIGHVQFVKELYNQNSDPDKIAKLIVHSLDQTKEDGQKDGDQTFIYPIEHMMLVFLHMNNLNSISSYNIDTIVGSFIKQNPVLNKVSDAFCKDYKTRCSTVLEQYVNMPKAVILENMLTSPLIKGNSWQTWNLFSVSMIFLNIILNIFNERKFKTGFLNKWLKLLLLNTHPDYKRRKSIEDNMSLFSKLCYSNTMEDFYPAISF